MKLVHDWYMIQAGCSDSTARKMKFDDELMGQLIRFVSSHEIGHTLGLRHNMGASHATPVDSLRNKEWVEKHGHTASIMDYARFNYVAQPEDNVGRDGLFPASTTTTSGPSSGATSRCSAPPTRKKTGLCSAR